MHTTIDAKSIYGDPRFRAFMYAIGGASLLIILVILVVWGTLTFFALRAHLWLQALVGILSFFLVAYPLGLCFQKLATIIPAGNGFIFVSFYRGDPHFERLGLCIFLRFVARIPLEEIKAAIDAEIWRGSKKLYGEIAPGEEHFRCTSLPPRYFPNCVETKDPRSRLNNLIHLVGGYPTIVALQLATSSKRRFRVRFRTWRYARSQEI